MIDGALPYLRCPVCEDTVARADARTLRCPRGHSFDVAKQGYVNLTTGRMPHSGDSAEMIADRSAFLADGHYDFIARALAGPTEGLVVDAGTGTGWYLAHVLDASPGTTGLGIDVSKPALRRAARAHPRAGAVLADLWRKLPLADGSASLLLNVFAPRNGPEFRRILRPDGRLLVITPAPDHLAELISSFGLIRVDPDKAERVTENLGSQFVVEHSGTHRHTMRLTGAEMRTLIGMTPSARHIAVPDLPDEEVSVTAAVDVTAYRPV
jgi:23S rRNA (guanine745-N1)-methyltransferase